MNETRVTVHGNVVSDPVERLGRSGHVFTTFRIATTPFRRTADGKFVDLDTSFYSVIVFNALAANVAASLHKGQPVVVEGNLSIQQYLGTDGQQRTSAEIDADHVGHDLSWGRAAFERVSRAAALGHDRTADPDIRDAVAKMAGDGRPANVDENGVVLDGSDEVDAAGEGPDSPPASLLGDPETDDYDVEQVPA